MVAVTVRDVPDGVRDELAARSAQLGAAAAAGHTVHVRVERLQVYAVDVAGGRVAA